jgi:hypothetical protein
MNLACTTVVGRDGLGERDWPRVVVTTGQSRLVDGRCGDRVEQRRRPATALVETYRDRHPGAR